MEFEPKSKKEILQELSEYKKQDYKYSSGRILGSMCTSPHPFALEVFTDFLETNLGDPGLFQGTKKIEDKTIRLIGKMLGREDVYGNIVTGGTEANLMAIRGARNKAKLEGVKSPEVIVPQSAHFSFEKAQDLLGVKLIKAPLTDEYKINTDFVEENITDNTVAIVGVAGSTELGKIDNIEKLSQISTEHKTHLHVDAAFGGFIIPFLEKYKNLKFDFRLDGVDSITIDPHKMGLAPIPSGCILFKDKKLLDAMAISTPYLTRKTQSTIVGTRLGASAVATYAIMNHLGYSGYVKLANEAMDKTLFLKKELEDLGYELVSDVELNLIGFNHPQIETSKLAEILKDYGWMVSESKYPKSIRLVLMTHITQKHLQYFINDLKQIKETIN